MSKQEGWTTIRVSKATLASLERVRTSMLTGDDYAVFPLDGVNCRSGEEDKRGRIGLDRVIRRLILDRWRWHRRRTKASGRSPNDIPDPLSETVDGTEGSED